MAIVFAISADRCLAATEQNEKIRHLVESTAAGYPLAVLDQPLSTQHLLRTFYTARNYQLVWSQDGTFIPGANALVDKIATIGAEGLNPEDYHWPILEKIRNDVSPSQLADYDLLLSDAFMLLGSHILSGKVNPESITPEWKANRRQRDFLALLNTALTTGDVVAVLNDLYPKQVRYLRLKQALAEIRNHPAINWPALALSPAIKPDMPDPRLAAIRARLAYWDDLSANAMANNHDGGVYDEPLQQAIKRFQHRHGLEEDGVIGKATLTALNITPEQRAQQIVLNMERWRWLAEDLGDMFVIVNIAGFELKVIDHNNTVLRKPVIVGRHYRRTPVFSDKIRYLVLNPNWTVPPKLAVNDKLPEARRDPDYLPRLGFRVYEQSTNTLIDPTTVDWQQVTGRNFHFRFVQSPGPQNALGQIKFMFPNVYNVYLHDTPSRELFSKAERAFSSGCIRVKEPLDLAGLLLQDQGWDRQRLEAAIATGKTETIYLSTPLPIHLEYWTAWVEGNGTLHFRTDIYGRDEPLALALQASH